MRIRRGDLFWLGPAHSPAGVRHPWVVVQDDLFNRSRVHSVVVCGLTTQLAAANEPGNVLLDDGEGGLPRRSVVVVSQISAVDRADLGEPIGRLSGERVDQILAGLRFQQRAFFHDDEG